MKEQRLCVSWAANLALLGFAAPACATESMVAVSSAQAGVTPADIGYNMGHYLPGSTTSAWVDYSQVNAYRVWASPGDYEPENSSTFGDGITTLAHFEARRSAVRANPEGNGFIPWAEYNDRFENLEQTGRNHVKLNYILSELRNRNITPLMQITRTESYPFNGWDGRYEQWQHFYAMAYHAAKNYDVERFQMYNEPDQSTATITQPEWQERLKLASDAVRSAIQDVNRDFGKSLTADVSAPIIKSGADSVATWDTPGSQDWGKQALMTNRTDYAGRTVSYDIFNTYDLHRYADSNPLSKYTEDGQLLASEIPQYNASGQAMPYAYSEYNRRSTAGFNNRPTKNLDTPQMYTELAQINLLAMAQGVSGMYAFKFNQTDFSGSPQKTGFFYVSEAGNKDTTGATRAAGVQRLFAKGFKGERPRLATGGTSVDTYDVATSFDDDANRYYLTGVNRHVDQTHTVLIDLNAWDVRKGSYISVEEVSENHHGEVTRFVRVWDSRKIQLIQPAQSVWLVTAPSGAAQQHTEFSASEDAQVRNSDPATGKNYRDKNFGNLPTAAVARSADNAGGDIATYLKFDIGDTDVQSVSRAILWVTGQNVTSESAELFHVYGLVEDSWQENSIAWANAPGLSNTDAKLVSVADGGATPVGHLSFDGTLAEWGIDITEYLQKQPDGLLSFALIREESFAGDVSDNVVQLFTSESAYVPRLSLFTEMAGVAGFRSGMVPMSARLAAVPEPRFLGLTAIGAYAALLKRRRR